MRLPSAQDSTGPGRGPRAEGRRVPRGAPAREGKGTGARPRPVWLRGLGVGRQHGRSPVPFLEGHTLGPRVWAPVRTRTPGDGSCFSPTWASPSPSAPPQRTIVTVAAVHASQPPGSVPHRHTHSPRSRQGECGRPHRTDGLREPSPGPGSHDAALGPASGDPAQGLLSVKPHTKLGARGPGRPAGEAVPEGL